MRRTILIVPAALAALVALLPAHAAKTHASCNREVRVGSPGLAYAAFVRSAATAYRAPGRAAFARFGRNNANGYPTLFSVREAVRDRSCRTAWYRVQLPLRPNGATGYVPAGEVSIARIRTRIVVDLSAHRLTLLRRNRPVLRTTVGVGSAQTPTPTGHFYVNQRLVPSYKDGPWGPSALGVSAFSPVLRSWTQGGPIAIHGTNDPSSVGGNVSHGCVRVRNSVMNKLFTATLAGSPVLIHR